MNKVLVRELGWIFCWRSGTYFLVIRWEARDVWEVGKLLVLSSNGDENELIGSIRKWRKGLVGVYGNGEEVELRLGCKGD